jgi:hypothetical protein
MQTGEPPRGPYLYLMLHVRRAPDDSVGACCGRVERLGTGEKRDFGSTQELLAWLEHWLPGQVQGAPEPLPEQDR